MIIWPSKWSKTVWRMSTFDIVFFINFGRILSTRYNILIHFCMLSVSWNTILEYPQRVLWKTWRFFFEPYPWEMPTVHKRKILYWKIQEEILQAQGKFRNKKFRQHYNLISPLLGWIWRRKGAQSYLESSGKKHPPFQPSDWEVSTVHKRTILYCT